MASPRFGVLFVCTGNICRSPTADGVFRKMVREAGLGGRILVDSAGVSGWHEGEAPDPRSQEEAVKRGYDLSMLRARAVVPSDFIRFNLLLAMDKGHERQLLAMAPSEERGRVRLFMSFAEAMGASEVPDPYYGGRDGFSHVLDLIEAACRGLLSHAIARLEA